MEVKAGVKVQVTDPNLQLLSDVFEIKEFIPPNFVRIQNLETGEIIRVHKTRVHKLKGQEKPEIEVRDKENTVEEVKAKEAKETKVQEATEPEVKTAKTEPKKAEKVDFSQIKGERWCKEVKFDHSKFKVMAHVVIAEDSKSFTTFNTYNGSFGKNGNSGKTYPIKGDPEKYRVKLAKKGYAKT